MIDMIDNNQYKYTLRCVNGHEWKSNNKNPEKCPQCEETNNLRYPGNW